MRQEKILLLGWKRNQKDEYMPFLRELGDVIEIESPADADLLFAEGIPTLILVSMPLPLHLHPLLKKWQGLPNRPFTLFLLEAQKPQHATEAIQAGADEILRLPSSHKEFRTRLQLLLERRQRESLGKPDTQGAGQLSEISVRELVELFARGRGTATLELQSPAHRARLFFRQGQLQGATLDHRHGIDALARLLSWAEGNFTSVPTLPPPSDETSSLADVSDPLTTALQLQAEWETCFQILPQLSMPIQVDFQRVQQNLEQLNPLAEQLLWQLAAHRSLEKLIDAYDNDLQSALQELLRLYQQKYFYIQAPEATESTSHLTHVVRYGESAASLETMSHPDDALETPSMEFRNGLALAAQEAAVQLKAAAQTSAVPIDSIDRDRYPSFLELPIPPSGSHSEASWSASVSQALDSIFSSSPAHLAVPPTPLSAAKNTLPDTEAVTAFEYDDFKSADEHREFPAEGLEDWNLTPHISLSNHDRVVTTQTELTATVPQSPNDLLESSPSLTDSHNLPTVTIEPVDNRHKIHTLSSHPSFVGVGTSSSPLPTGEFESFMDQRSHRAIPDDGTIKPLEPSHVVDPSLPISAPTSTTTQTAPDQSGLVASTPETGAISEDDLPFQTLAKPDLPFQTLEKPDHDDVKNLLRTETLDILGKIVQTELSLGSSVLTANSPVSSRMTLTIGQVVPSQEELPVPTALAEHRPASSTDLEALKPAVSYTLEFDAPPSSPRLDAATPLSLESGPSKIQTSVYTDSFGSFHLTPEKPHGPEKPAHLPFETSVSFPLEQPPTASPSTANYPAKAVPRARRPPSLEIPSPNEKEDTHIGIHTRRSHDELRLSDEFFLGDEDIQPRKRNRIRSFFVWLLISVFFAGLGFLGMAGYARLQQGQSFWPWQTPTTPIARLGRTRPTPPPRHRRRVERPTVPTNASPPSRLGASDPSPRPGTSDPTNTTTLGQNTAATGVPAPPERDRPVVPVRPDHPSVPTNTTSTSAPIEEPRRREETVEEPRLQPRPRSITRQRPRTSPTSPRNRARKATLVARLYQQALTMKKREKFRIAENLLRRALRLKPRKPAPIYSLLGQVLYEREQTNAAVRFLERAYKVSPRDTGDGLVTLGSIYYEKGKRTQARVMYQQYLRFFPKGRHVNDVKAMLRN